LYVPKPVHSFKNSKILSAVERIGCHLRQQLPGFLQQQQQKNPLNVLEIFCDSPDVNKKCEGARPQYTFGGLAKEYATARTKDWTSSRHKVQLQFNHTASRENWERFGP
jgi:hypothetical protein